MFTIDQPWTGRVLNRCPKCGGRTFSIYTRVEVLTRRDFEHGEQVDGPDEVASPEDIASDGHCRCGHKWHLRDSTLNYVDTMSEGER